jgi:hypothetical protein
MSAIRKSMDKKQFTQDPDVFSVATLLKVWFRELPHPLLQAIPKDALYNEDPVECFQAVDKLPDLEHTLFRWLVELMYETSLKSSVNKMTFDNLGTTYTKHF